MQQANGRPGFDALAEALASELVEPAPRRVVELLREEGEDCLGYRALGRYCMWERRSPR